MTKLQQGRKEENMDTKLIQPRAAKWGLLISFLAVFALITGLCLPGCSENPSTSSDTILPEDDVSFFDQPFDEVQYARLVELAAVDEDILFGELPIVADDGGTIVVGTKGNYHEFEVPPGALPYNEIIRVEIIKVESKKDEIAVIYDFDPDGLVFNTSAYLKIDVAKVLGKRATSANLYYLDESVDTPRWILYDSANAGPDGVAVFSIDHFSKYGVD